MNQTKNSEPAETKPISVIPKWITETINGGSLRYVDLQTGTNGWATPPANIFTLRSTNYFKNKQKCPGGDYLLSPVGVDWLKSTTKLDHILARPDNRVSHALKKAQSQDKSLNSFIFAVNFQIPGKEPYSIVYYFATEEPIPSESLLYKFINGDDTYRNQRFKCVSQVVKGPWVVKAAAGSFGAFLLSKAVSCNYYRGSNYFEVDVDISSSKILTTLLRFMFGYITSLVVDIGLVVEAQREDELPEKLIGGVRMCHLEPSSAFVVDDRRRKKIMQPCRMMGSVEVNNNDDDKV